MKYLRLFENTSNIFFSKETLWQHQRFEEILFSNMQDYLFWKTGKYPEEYEFNVKGYHNGRNGDFVIEYLDADDQGCLWEIKKHDQDDMYKFLNDPEMFSDANKYNL